MSAVKKIKTNQNENVTEISIQESSAKREKIRLYLGYAPGKTTALNGIVLRAIGAGLRVKLILFSKCESTTSESKVYEILKQQFSKHFDFFFAGTSRIRDNGSFRFFGDEDGWTLQDELKLEQGLKQLTEDTCSGKYDLICVDELTDLLYHKEQRVPEKTAKLLFKSIHFNTTVIVTGHLCPEWLMEMATTIVEGKVKKHYQGYTKGIEW